MAKLPSNQFYPGDWMKDAELGACEPATRGIWIDWLCAMHDLDQCGQLTGTAEQLARLGRCTPSEVLLVVQDLTDQNAATVTHRNGKITVINRRMKRKYEERFKGAKRAKKYRNNHFEDQDEGLQNENNGQSNAFVTEKSLPPSSSSSSSSSSDQEKNPLTPLDFFKPPAGPLPFIPSSAPPPVGPLLNGGSPEVHAVVKAYPRSREIDGRHQAVKVTLPDYDRVALFMNRNPAYPLLRAVQLLSQATTSPPDLGNFLENPWTMESLEAKAQAKPGNGLTKKTLRELAP